MVYMKTCCYCFDTKNGSFACGVYTMVVKVIAAIGLIISLAVLPVEKENQASGFSKIGFREDGEIGIYTLFRGSVLRGSLTISLVYCLSFVIFCGLLIYGAKNDRANFLLPWIVAMSVEVAINIISVFVMLFMTISFPILSTGAAVSIILSLAIFAGFGIYMILCVESVRKRLEQHACYSPTDAIKPSV